MGVPMFGLTRTFIHSIASRMETSTAIYRDMCLIMVMSSDIAAVRIQNHCYNEERNLRKNCCFNLWFKLVGPCELARASLHLYDPENSGELLHELKRDFRWRTKKRIKKVGGWLFVAPAEPFLANDVPVGASVAASHVNCNEDLFTCSWRFLGQETSLIQRFMARSYNITRSSPCTSRTTFMLNSRSPLVGEKKSTRPLLHRGLNWGLFVGSRS